MLSSLAKYPMVMQHDEMDCAAACLAMITAYYGRPQSLHDCRQAVGVGPEGASFYSLALAAEQMGLISSGLRLSMDELLMLDSPAIVTQGYHFVVLYKTGPKALVIADPERGLSSIGHEDFLAEWTGVALILKPNQKFLTLKASKAAEASLKPLLRPLSSALIAIATVSLSLSVYNIATPLLTKRLIDQVLIANDPLQFRAICIASGLSLLMIALGGLFRRKLVSKLSMRLTVELSAVLVHRLLALPYKFFAQRRLSDSLARLGDIELIQHFIAARGLETVVDVLSLGLFIVGLSCFYPQIALLMGLSLLAFFGLLFLISKIAYPHYVAKTLKGAEARGMLIEALRGIQTTKAFSAETAVRWRWERKLVAASQSGFQLEGLESLSHFVTEVYARGAPLVALLWGGSLVLQGSMTVGEVLAFMSFLGLSQTPIINLATVQGELSQVYFGLKRLSDVFQSPSEETAVAAPKAIKLNARSLDLSLRNLSFSYGGPDAEPVLKDLNLKIRFGTKLAVIGASGSGKTSLVQLFNRIYEPSTGQLLLGGIDLKNIALTELRSMVAVVSQDMRLYSGTILENIAFGDPLPDLWRAKWAATKANALSFIESLDAGFNHPLFEDGQGLSTGQRQRLAIARALYRQPKILVLDEATSALDRGNESEILARLPELAEDRTVIAITHKIETLRYFDEVLELSQGQVRYYGPVKGLKGQVGMQRSL